MATVMKCDRCGKIYDCNEDSNRDYSRIAIGHYDLRYPDEFFGIDTWDLCPECIDATYEFMGYEKCKENSGYIKKEEACKKYLESLEEKEEKPNIRLDILKVIEERMCERFNVNPILKEMIHSVIFPNDIIYEEDVFTYNYIFKYHGSIVLSLPLNCSHKDIVLMIKAEEKLYEEK